MTLVQCELKKRYVRVEETVDVLFSSQNGTIKHYVDRGFIEIENPDITSIIISDKNLGATSSDTSNQNSWGNYYQRGNNYGFKAGMFTTSSTAVNTSAYGYNNNYIDAIFRTASASPYDWSSPQNNDLWGATNGTLQSHHKGPCDEGWHIPSTNEFSALQSLFTNITGLSTGASRNQYLLIPIAGCLHRSSGAFANNTFAFLWTYNVSGTNAVDRQFQNTTGGISASNQYRAFGFNIRPFKDVGGEDITYKSYEQIMGTITTLSSYLAEHELNRNASGYFQKFTDEGKIINTQLYTNTLEQYGSSNITYTYYPQRDLWAINSF